MPHGTIGPYGNVTITFNVEEDPLFLPDGRRLLPCETCGDVQPIAPNVVSFVCAECLKCHCGSTDVELLIDHLQGPRADLLVCNACGDARPTPNAQRVTQQNV